MTNEEIEYLNKRVKNYENLIEEYKIRIEDLEDCIIELKDEIKECELLEQEIINGWLR